MTEKIPETTCQECPAWVRDPSEEAKKLGGCRAHPPTVVLAPVQKNRTSGTISYWPMTGEDQWCTFGRVMTLMRSWPGVN